MQFNNVDLPQPDGPTRTRKSPLSIFMLISFKTEIFQKFLFTFFIFNIDDISYPFTDPAVKPLMKYLPANT